VNTVVKVSGKKQRSPDSQNLEEIFQDYQNAIPDGNILLTLCPNSSDLRVQGDL